MKSIREYHDAVSYDRREMKGGVLDWNNRPSVFKEYPDIEAIALPGEVGFPPVPALDLMTGVEDLPAREKVDVKELGAILSLSCGLTARAPHGSEWFYYRAAPSAGGLYPVEVYFSATGIDGLDDGLYHFSVSRFALFPLRRMNEEDPHSDKNALTTDASAQEITFFLTAVLFRSAWKYRDRAYRYHLLDTGHVAENLLLALRLLGMNGSIDIDFPDTGLAEWLGLDTNSEVPLAVVHCGGNPDRDTVDPAQQTPLSLRSSPVANREIPFPLIADVHRLCSEPFRGQEPDDVPLPQFPSVREWVRLDENGKAVPPADFARTVSRRRSRRNFIPARLEAYRFRRLLSSLCLQEKDPDKAFEEGFVTAAVVGNVEGMEPGFYRVDPGRNRIGAIRSDDMAAAVARSCLEQMWLANSSVQFVFCADLDLLEKRFGPRAYRAAMIRAGRLGQRVYLAATALDLGCCGIGAFYDGELRDVLGLEEPWRVLYVAAAGVIKAGAIDVG